MLDSGSKVALPTVGKTAFTQFGSVFASDAIFTAATEPVFAG